MDSKSAFVKRFGDLIALLRVDPGNDAAQDLALAAATAAVEADPVEVEAGIEWSVIPDDLTLKGRLLARQVEAVRIAAGTEPHELLALARALSHDVVPIPSSPNIHVDMVQVLVPPPAGPSSAPTGGRPDQVETQARRDAERRSWDERRRPGRGHYLGVERRRSGDRRVSGERRVYLIRNQQAEITRLHELLARGARGLAWEAVLTAALALVRITPKVPASQRRGFGIQVRRAIPRRAVESLVDLAEHDTGIRDRTAEVLHWIGIDAAEVVLDRLLEGDAVGVRAFYYEVLVGMPGVYPLVTPLLRSHRLHEVRQGADLLARLRRPEAIDDLAPLLTHPEEAARVAAVHAMGEIHEGPAAEPLREALHHPDAHVRAAAAEAIAVWRNGALALLLVAALEAERNRDAWQALITALGRLGTFETCSALAGVALTRRSLLRRHGYSVSQRLAAVAALGLAASPEARATLARLAHHSEGVVAYAADRVLRAEQQRAG